MRATKNNAEFFDSMKEGLTRCVCASRLILVYLLAFQRSRNLPLTVDATGIRGAGDRDNIHEAIMKQGVHPDYKEVQVNCSSCGNAFTTRSTVGKPLGIGIEVRQLPPFYTGKQRIVDTAGRVEKFRQNTPPRRPLDPGCARHERQPERLPFLLPDAPCVIAGAGFSRSAIERRRKGLVAAHRILS